MREWARHTHGSPLYAHLSEVVARSDELLRVTNRIVNLPRQNVLFAAVHYLLMQGAGPDLSRFYPSLRDDPVTVSDVDPVFTGFVLEHEDEIVEIGRTRYTQTNESRRAVVLLPAIWETTLSRFHLVDVGASAGLNLFLDLYRYRWNGLEWGLASPVILETELRGRELSPRDLTVLGRVGLDLHPVDSNDPDDRRWLEALIWPEHPERRERLRSALDLAQTVPLNFVAGSALDTLASTLDGLPADDPAVVMTSFTLNQFTEDQRGQFESIVSDGRRRRPVAWVWFEHMHRDDPWPKFGFDEGSGRRVLGEAHPHGEWMEFYTRP